MNPKDQFVVVTSIMKLLSIILCRCSERLRVFLSTYVFMAYKKTGQSLAQVGIFITLHPLILMCSCYS